MLLACGLRRHEAAALRLDHLQQREEHWAIVDLVGKGGNVRTVPVPDWVRTELDDWIAAAAIDRGKLFRRVNKVGRTWGDGMTVKAVWHIVNASQTKTEAITAKNFPACAQGRLPGEAKVRLRFDLGSLKFRFPVSVVVSVGFVIRCATLPTSARC